MLVVVGGYNDEEGYGNWVEIVNIDGIPYDCDEPEPYPIQTEGSIGGIVNNQLMVCGGRITLNSCYRLNPNTGKWKKAPDMLQGREYAAYSEIPQNKGLFVMGSLDTTTEILKNGKWAYGPSLPTGQVSHYHLLFKNLPVGGVVS